MYSSESSFLIRLTVMREIFNTFALAKTGLVSTPYSTIFYQSTHLHKIDRTYCLHLS